MKNMSLTSFLKIKEVKDAFATEFKKPKLKLDWKIKALPKTNHYSLVGTAFDYLLRFYLERLNPYAIAEPWVANTVRQIVLLGFMDTDKISEQDQVYLNTIKKRLEEMNIDYLEFGKAVEKTIRETKALHSEYIETGDMSDELIRHTILLAQIDSVYRGLYLDKNIVTRKVDEEDVKDLKNMISIVPKEDFKTKSICLLNPTFGKASELVGGADADLVIDNRLIDIKTTKKCEIFRHAFNQIIGYYILGKIGKIGEEIVVDGSYINELGIYFSRFGKCYLFNVDDIINQDTIAGFMDWFKTRAQREFKTKI